MKTWDKTWDFFRFFKKKRCQRRRSGVFNVNFEHISHLFLMFLLTEERFLEKRIRLFISHIRIEHP